MTTAVMISRALDTRPSVSYDAETWDSYVVRHNTVVRSM